MGKFKAAAAKICITPPADMLPGWSFMGFQLGGVYQDIYGRTLILDTDEGKLVFVTYDGADMGRTDDLCRAIEDAYGIPEDNLHFAVTHSHEAPCFDDTLDSVVENPEELVWVKKYGDFVIAQTVRMIGEALTALRPAKLGFATGESYVNVCRDEELPNGTWIQGMDFTGPCDHTLFVMEVRDLQDHLIAGLINFGVHGTCCFMKQNEEGTQYLIAGDLPGMTSLYLEEQYKDDDAVFLWTSGAAANVNPIFFSSLTYYNHDGTTTSVDTGYEAWETCEALAERHSVDIIKVMNGMKPEDFTEEVTWKVIERTVTLPGIKLERSDGKPGPIPPSEHGKPVKIADAPDQILHLRLTVINDVAFLGMNAELVAEIGLRLKEEVPFEHFVIVTHTGERIGYLPDRQGYERKTFAFYATKVRDGLAEELMTPVIMEMCEEAKPCATSDREENT